MTDTSPTTAQQAAQQAILELITDAIKEIRADEMELVPLFPLIESLASSYRSVVGDQKQHANADTTQ
jgi:hypothetical protein